MSQTVQTEDGTIHEFPDEATPQMISEALGLSGVQAPKVGLMQSVINSYDKGAQTSDAAINAYQQGQQTFPETALQVGGAGAGFTAGAIGDVASSVTPQFLKDLGSSALGALGQLPMIGGGTMVQGSAQAANDYSQFEANNPRAARNIGAIANLASILPAGKGVEAAGTAVKATGDAGLTAAKKLGQGAVDATMKTAQIANNATDNIAGTISSAVNRSGLAPEIAALPDADALFIKSLQDEGISPDSALAQLSQAREVGGVPSVSVASNVPSMQTQAYLASKGSAGSRVAAKAIEDIDTNQIPTLNDKIIQAATGGETQGAEAYGQSVSKAAKDMVDARKDAMKTRAKPYYQEAVGLDKSVPIENPEMKKALGNPVVMKALEDARTDPYTRSTVVKDLADYGVDASEMDALPYNSTISLHAARTNLRGQADTAFAANDTLKYKAIKGSLEDIDNAIESAYPSYKKARRIYSEDAGLLKALNDSPIGKMATLADGNYSKIANDLMTKDPQYISKFVNNLGTSGANGQKVKDALAGAFLKRTLEESANDGRRFGDKVFRNEASANRLKALVGESRFNQMKKIDGVIDQLLKTRNIPAQSITSAANTMKEGFEIPSSVGGVLTAVRKKIAPSLLDQVLKNPESAARYNELLFTDEGYKLLEKVSPSKQLTSKEINEVGKFINSAAKEKK